MAELSTTHVSMITNDLPHMFRWHILFHRIDKAKLPLLCIALRLQLLPFTGCMRKQHNQSISPLQDRLLIEGGPSTNVFSYARISCFCSCDLDLDLDSMNLIHEPDFNILKMYLHIKKWSFCVNDFKSQSTNRTDTQTDTIDQQKLSLPHIVLINQWLQRSIPENLQ